MGELDGGERKMEGDIEEVEERVELRRRMSGSQG